MSGSPAPENQQPATRRARGAFASRVVAATAVVAAFAALAWADAVGLWGARPLTWLIPVIWLVAVGSSLEVVRLAAAADVPLGPVLLPFIAASIALSHPGAEQAAAGDPRAVFGPAAVTAMFFITLAFATAVATYAPGRRTLARAVGTIAAGVSIGLPLAFMAALRLLPTGDAAAGPGLLPLVSLIAVVKAGDIAAYLVGAAVGRHRMAPTLSPGKTWEGAAASLAASLAVAWLVIEWIGGTDGPRPTGGWPLYGLLVGAAGMLGDLAESLVKRDLGAKDSGSALGGMGGCLDLIDSLLLAAPVAWVLWTAGGGR